MSWEEMDRTDYPCKCGKGTFTAIVEMDDWNRSRKKQILNCPECAAEERRIYFERKKREEEEQARLKELYEEIKNHFETHYMEKWLTYFAAARNKKAVWSLANNIGVEIYSLASFYQSNKRRSMEEYIRKLAQPFNMDKIMKALEIVDTPFKSKVDEFMGLEGRHNFYYYR